LFRDRDVRNPIEARIVRERISKGQYTILPSGAVPQPGEDYHVVPSHLVTVPATGVGRPIAIRIYLGDDPEFDRAQSAVKASQFLLAQSITDLLSPAIARRERG